jgi:hypothetical protein
VSYTTNAMLMGVWAPAANGALVTSAPKSLAAMTYPAETVALADSNKPLLAGLGVCSDTGTDVIRVAIEHLGRRFYNYDDNS